MASLPRSRFRLVLGLTRKLILEDALATGDSTMYDAQSSTTRARRALRWGLAFIWIYEGLVPKWLTPLTDLERSVVAASGLIPNDSADAFRHLLGILEILLGLLILAGIAPRTLCIVQATSVAAF